ncbi:MAG: enoyl-CoA hydratase-related protein [Dehalococcoidia bacterium]
MEYRLLSYIKEEGIGIVSINRPQSLNALNGDVYAELYELFQQIENDPEVRVVIITGSGEKAFVAGSDIGEMQPQNSIEIRGFIHKARKASDRIYTLSKPVIAAVNGFALGGGCELAMCCDFRIASENAKFGQPEMNLGIIPGAGGTQRLTRLVGMTRAKELVYTGCVIDANVAYTMGLVNKVVSPNDLMSEAKALARRLLVKSSVALSLAKEAINGGSDASLHSGLDLEGQCFALCFATHDQKEGMAAFLEKRKPEFRGK